MLTDNEEIVKGPLVFKAFKFSGFLSKQRIILTRPSKIRKLFAYSDIESIIACYYNGDCLFYIFYAGVSAVEYGETPISICKKCSDSCIDKDQIYVLVENMLDFEIAEFYGKGHFLRWVNSSTVDEIIRYKDTVKMWLRYNSRRSSRTERNLCSNLLYPPRIGL